MSCNCKDTGACDRCFRHADKMKTAEDKQPSCDDSQPPKAEPVSIEVWLYHPDIMSRVGEFVFICGEIKRVTKTGLEPYC